MFKWASVHELAAAHPLFRGLEAEVLARLLGRVREVHHRAGEIIYQSGHEAQSVSILVRGALQIEYPSPGEERGPVNALFVAPALLGEAQVLATRAWSGTGVALTDLVLLGFDREAWLELLAKSPAVTRRLYLELAGRFLLAIETWRNQPELGPAELIARYCAGVRLAFERCRIPEPSELPLDQKALALATGLTRETVNRTLKAWAENGLVLARRGRLSIGDPAALEALAGPSLSHFVKSYWAPAD